MIFPDYIQEFDASSIGRRIQDMRIEKGIKALDMAVQLDLSKSQYSRIESGACECKITILHKIAQYLEVSADYLLYGREEKLYTDQIYLLMKGMKKKEREKVMKVVEIMSS